MDRSNIEKGRCNAQPSRLSAGHSERREGFGGPGESDEVVATKTKVAIDAGLKVR